MSTLVSFADLTHTGVAIDANNNPLAVGYIAAYATQQLGRDINARLFKYPDAFTRFLRDHAPTIACFTNYMWNERLACGFAKAIKTHAPKTLVVMGGPNYPVDASEQHAYLAQHKEIDFFADGEGELAFVNLFRALSEVGFDGDRLRRSGAPVAGFHYLIDGQFVRGETLPRILDMDATLPSPYTTGLLDEFFDDRLTPMVQTARGCPYSCTFCHDGIAYMNKTRAFSYDRVDAELSYIESRSKTATLQLADLNWGMFPGDIRTAKRLAESRERTGWPRNIMVATAKNQKDRIIEMVRLLGDALQVGASVQSTDPEVLRLVKRSNISLDAIVKMSMRAGGAGTGSFTELILGLPGDTKSKHMKSVCDMLDAGIEELRLFQFILLPGTEGNDLATRARHEYRTGFRALARGFGRYEAYGDPVEAVEIQEVCLGTNTMPPDEYRDCRAFDLTISIFNNGGVLREFFRMCQALGIKRSTVLLRIFELAQAATASIREIYDELFTEEARNFFPTREALESFLSQPGTLDAYLRGDYGVNHIFRARSRALVESFGEIVEIAHRAVAIELRAHGIVDPVLDLYLDELAQVTRARKSDLVDVDRVVELTLHFDFPALRRVDYRADPRQAHVPAGVRQFVRHSDDQRTNLPKYFAQYGTSLDGLGQFFQRNDSHLSTLLYRTVDYAEPFESLPLVAEQPQAVEVLDAVVGRLDSALDAPLLREGAAPTEHPNALSSGRRLRVIRRAGAVVLVMAVGLGVPAGHARVRRAGSGPGRRYAPWGHVVNYRQLTQRMRRRGQDADVAPTTQASQTL